MTTALAGGEWSAARPSRTLPPGKTWYPLYRRLGGPQGRSGWAENLVPPGFDPRTVQPVAQSLYWLSYPAHFITFSAMQLPSFPKIYNVISRGGFKYISIIQAKLYDKCDSSKGGGALWVKGAHNLTEHRSMLWIFFSRMDSIHLTACICYEMWGISVNNYRGPLIMTYSRVSFYDGSFYNASLLRPLSSRTEHSRPVVRHCHNSSILSLLSVLLALFWCACVGTFALDGREWTASHLMAIT